LIAKNVSGSRGGFAVRITAVDSASKQIDAINARIRAMQAPAERLQKSFGKLADNTGVTALTNGFRGLARESLQAFENIGRVVGPLGAITGAASVAGLARLTSQWADYGTHLQFAAQRSGLAVGQLSALQGAARLAGVSAETLTSGMTQLKDNIFEINAGRGAPMTIAAFNSLGITLRDKVTGQLRSTTSVLPELADKIAAVKDPTMQATYATLTLGGAGEAMLPFLRLGAAGMAEYSEKAVRYGAMSESGAAAANELRLRQAELTLATEGLGYAISEKLAPVIGPLLTDLAGWISDNRDIIGTDVAGWVNQAVPQIKSFAKEANSVAEAMGGWKTVIEALIGIQLGSWALRMVAGLNPLTIALAGIAITLDRLSTFEQRSGPANLPIGSPLWRGISREEQLNYARSPAAQEFLHPNGENPNPYHWYNPGSWLDRGPGPAGDPRGIRNNNPLNLAYVPGQPGVAGSDGRFGIYHTMAEGIAADEKQLIINQQRHGLNTLREQINRWAPPSDNDTPAYLRGISRMTGIDPDARIDVTNPQTAREIIGAMAYQENGRAVPDRDIAAGVNMALGPPATVGGGTGAPPADTTTTVRGSADLKITLNGFPRDTSTVTTTEGDLFHGPPPRVAQAMPAYQ
jgi:hypothetical protein